MVAISFRSGFAPENDRIRRASTSRSTIDVDFGYVEVRLVEEVPRG